MHKTYRCGWHYDSKASVLRLEGTQMSGAFVDYEVDLGACRNSAEILDWIAQVAKKNWITPEIVYGLVVALDDLLDLQASICGGGLDRDIDPSAVISSRLSTGKIREQ